MPENSGIDHEIIASEQNPFPAVGSDVAATQESPSPFVRPLSEVLQNTLRYCGKEVEDKNGVVISEFKEVTLFKGVDRPNRNDLDHQAEYVSNIFYDDVMTFIAGIAKYSVRMVHEGNAAAHDYERTARAMESLARVGRALADDEIPLVRNTAEETYHALKGDKTSQYIAKDVMVDGKRYKEVRVLIRPEAYKGKDEKDDAQARLSFEAIPHLTSVADKDDLVHIRVDREDAMHGFMVTFDLQVGGRKNNVVDRLSFKNPKTEEDEYVFQRYSHHFESQQKTENFGVDYKAILEATDKKFTAQATKTFGVEDPVAA